MLNGRKAKPLQLFVALNVLVQRGNDIIVVEYYQNTKNLLRSVALLLDMCDFF